MLQTNPSLLHGHENCDKPSFIGIDDNSHITRYLNEIQHDIIGPEGTILDTGCSQTENVPKLLERHLNSNFHLILIDSPINNHGIAVETLQRLSEQYPGRLTFNSVKKTFHEKLAADDSLDLVVSSLTLYPPSVSPKCRNLILCPMDKEWNLKQITIENDWKIFLSLRHSELKRGGHLIVTRATSDINMGKLENMAFAEIINNAAEMMVSNGHIKRDFLLRNSFPFTYLTTERRIKVVEENTKDWKLLQWSVHGVNAPFWNQYLMDGNVNKYVNEARKCFETLLKPKMMPWFIEEYEEKATELANAFFDYIGQIFYANPVSLKLNLVTILAQKM